MQFKILVVDDEPGAIQVLARILDDLGEVLAATDGASALQTAHRCKPDLILLDANMPGMNGFDVCDAFRSDAELGDVPIIFVTSNDAPEFEVAGFEHGASDFISKPVAPALVRARVKAQLRMKQMGDELRRLAAEDSLTGLATRRRFDDALSRELGVAQRSGQPVSLLALDVDHFKRYNDHYGHPAGDACLRAVARAMLGACKRPADLVARVGGEEFAIVLPQTSLEASALVAHRVLDAVAALNIPHLGLGTDARISVSVGASSYVGLGRRDAHEPSSTGAMPWAPDREQLVAALVAAADKALYEAKSTGRNRACSLALGFGPRASVALAVGRDAGVLATAH